SPGGRTPNSERSRPEEPPSSATVTTAVRSTGRRRRADSDAGSPWPPPRAVTCRGSVVEVTSFAPEVAVDGAHVVPRLAHLACDLLGHRDAAVLAAGAPHRDRHEALALAEVAAGDAGQELHIGVDDLLRAGLTEDVLADLRRPAGLGPQVGHPERVGQEAHVGHEVGVHGDAVLEGEAEVG